MSMQWDISQQNKNIDTHNNMDEFEINQFSESSQPIKSTYCIIHLCKIPEKAN